MRSPVCSPFPTLSDLFPFASPASTLLNVDSIPSSVSGGVRLWPGRKLQLAFQVHRDKIALTPKNSRAPLVSWEVRNLLSLCCCSQTCLTHSAGSFVGYLEVLSCSQAFLIACCFLLHSSIQMLTSCRSCSYWGLAPTHLY